MCRILLCSFALFLTPALLAADEPKPQQTDRRDRKSPEVVVEAGGRMGTCDAMQFTADGRSLLVTGDDKVVRAWPCNEKGLDRDNVQILRWSVWREQSGSIYAMALSPDAENRLVAIAGRGARLGSVAVLDRKSGKILHMLSDPMGNNAVIRSLAFSPSASQVAFGTEFGGVWVWDLSKKQAKRLDTPKEEPKLTEANRVRLVSFQGERKLISVTEDGQVMRWEIETGKGEKTLDLSDKIVSKSGKVRFFRVILSPDGKWLAGAGQGPWIALRSLDGTKNHKIVMNNSRDFVRSIAFDAKGQRLAAGIGNADSPTGFYREQDDSILLYDLTANEPKEKPGPKHSYRADAVDFHPDGKRLAIAGGDNHEVTLWDMDKVDKPISAMQSAGSCLWSVALSSDGRYLAYRDQRDPTAPTPNQRGKGPWHVFDLELRRLVALPAEKLVEARSEEAGWTVKTATSENKDPYRWYVSSPQGTLYQIPWNKLRDSLPRCWTFLPATDKKPLRLAVGHYWGFSVFEITNQGVKRARLCTGHQGEVMSLAAAVDKDGREWVVSASTDQTIAAWNLDDYTSQPELGARFALADGRIRVQKVDLGSPAWEAGLVEGDEVALFAFNLGEFLYDPSDLISAEERARRRIKRVGTIDECAARLRRPVPDQEFYFYLKRAGQKELVEASSTIKQRPLWRFFPTRDREWVLWMWRNYYYDTSTNGDSLIGWHVNNRNMDLEPAFYKAEQFRQQFHRPDVIDRLLSTRNLSAALPKEALLPVNFDDKIEPPAVRIELKEKVVAAGTVEVKLTAAPRSDNPDHQPQRVELWINDFRYRTWKAGGKGFEETLKVPTALLRKGDNELTLQTYNKVGGRSEVNAPIVCNRASTEKPTLHGLIVGINDYSKVAPAPGGKRAFGDLKYARRDAEEMQKGWLGQKERMYQDAKLFLGVDKDVSRASLLKELKALQGKVGPDDRLILFLSGHGDLRQKGEGTDTFIFCCPDYDQKKFDETGVSSHDLYEALVALPCRKIVFLDACHSGNLAINQVRSLTPGGKGPIIMAACDRSEFSYEHAKLRHGVFTFAILEALRDGFGKADRDGNGELTAEEIYGYVQKRVPELLKEIDREDMQHPVCFPRKLEAYPLIGK